MTYSQAHFKHILDLKVDSFNTGLEEVGSSFWIDDNQFVMSTLQEGAQKAAKEEDTSSRVALINFTNKSIRYIAPDAQLLDFTFDHGKRSFFVGKMHTSNVLNADKTGPYSYTYENLRELRIEPNGEVIQIATFPSASKLPNAPESIDGEPLDGGRGGVLVRGLAPGDTYMKQWERLSQKDEGYPTVWVRAGKPPTPLPIRHDEITSGKYIAFLDKYLLNDSDTSGSSDTNSHLRGDWRRPYEYTPFRLLSQDGTIDEIPYPEFIFEYGIATRGQRNDTSRNFSKFLVTRPGILITKTRDYGSAIYLFKRDQLYLVAGGKTILHVDTATNSAEGLWSMKLSPDGCKVAYSHLRSTAMSSKVSDPHFFSIIDLCKNPN